MAKALQITARPAKGFRRCGIHHPATPTLHPLHAFDKKQVAQLLAEPQLIVNEVDAKDAPAEPEGGKGAGGKGGEK